MLSSSTAPEADDWYTANVWSLTIVFVCSIITFIVAFTIITTCVRLRFNGRSQLSHQTMDTPELVLIKNHTRLTRVLSLVGIALQVALVLRMSEISDADRSSFTFSLFRPVSNLCIYFLGFMTNTHAFFRLALFVLLGQVIVMDTIAQTSVAMVINCLKVHGLHCGSSALASLSRTDLERLQLRDQFALFLNPWLVLEVAFLSLTIGICSSRYSSRRLSLSRPRFNVRAALALYFPTQFGLNGTQVHHYRSRPKDWKI